jgi:hypothetical protein
MTGSWDAASWKEFGFLDAAAAALSGREQSKVSQQGIQACSMWNSIKLMCAFRSIILRPQTHTMDY